jgi:hypothetical protein
MLCVPAWGASLLHVLTKWMYALTVGVRDQALQPTGKPNPQWLPRGLQPPYVPVPFLNPPPVQFFFALMWCVAKDTVSRGTCSVQVVGR